MTSLREIAIAAAGALFLALAPTGAHAYSTLYVFGDSLSDAGNLLTATSQPGSPAPPQPVAPYYNGEFSNGPIWIEDLSARLGLGPVTPSLLGGNDYAFGGATTGYAGTVSPSVPVPTLQQQVGAFLTGTGGVAPSTALYSIWIGSNDVFNVVQALGTSTQPPSVAAALAAAATKGAAGVEAAAIAALAQHGATNFLVPLVGDLGQTPTLSGSATGSAAGTALALLYDATLEADLAALATKPGIDLTFLDTFTLLDTAIADPSAFGLTDVTAPCFTGTYAGGGSACSDPNVYLFWDALHPTAAGQALIAEDAYAYVPEPGTFAVLAVGLAGLAVLRRRPTTAPAMVRSNRRS